ncbi:MAG: FAD-dependent oxidoreductase [Deltaproteobacteria bacterium]|nr:FAD-dependent oxidoreductase [Deltaproteobacteria bacterium]
MAGSDKSADVLVVGGGLAGLSAAACAARAGAKVVLFEKAGTLGGRGGTQERDGFLLNQGAHALYAAGPGRGVLKELGVATPGRKPSAAVGYLIDGGAKHTFPGGFLSLLSTDVVSWPAKLEVARILATLPRLDASAWDAVSVDDALERLVRREEVRNLLRALIRLSTYGNDPKRQSAGAALAQLQLALSANVLYIDGGWRTLVDGLRGVAERAGVRIVSGVRVEHLESNGATVDVRVAGEESYRAGSVVLAIAPAEAAEISGGIAGAVLRRWAEAAIPVYAACLDVCLERVPVPRATFALGVDQSVYLSVHSAAARLAPEGRGLISLMKYLGPKAGDGEADERELEGVLDLVQPGWRDVTLHSRFLPRMVVSHGLATAAMKGLAGRPGPDLPGVGNVLVAGDWVGPEGLLADASLASGKAAGERAALRRPAAAAA